MGKVLLLRVLVSFALAVGVLAALFRCAPAGAAPTRRAVWMSGR